MRTFILAAAFFALISASAFGGGAIQNEPFNVQEINLENIENIVIRYSFENITLLKSGTDALVIKEYFNRDISAAYAVAAASANEILIRGGMRSGFSGALNFKARIEIYIPDSNKNFSLRTASGAVEGGGSYTANSITIESSSGNIYLNSVSAGYINLAASSGAVRGGSAAGNLNLRTASGNIFFGSVSGDVDARSSSGRIEINRLTGSLSAETSSGGMRFTADGGTVNLSSSSGRIQCSAGAGTKDVSITTASGDVFLEIPQTLAFNFLSRTSSGRIRAPFSDRLFSPFDDRNSFQGAIGGNFSENKEPVNIVIKTNSGSINAAWAD